MEDNNVYVNIKVNTDGIKFGTKEVSDAIARAAQDMSRYGKAAQTSCDSAANAFLKQNQAVANATAEVDRLEAKLAEMKTQKVKTSFLTDEEEALKTLEAEYSKLENQKLQMETSGKSNTQKYAETVELMRDINKEIERQKALLASLQNDPRSYTSADTTALEERLATAKQKQAAATNNASVAYEKFNNVLDKNRSKLESTAKSTKKVSASTFDLSKSFKKGLTTILKYGFGLRSLYVAWRKLRSAMIEGFKTLAKENPQLNAAISGVATQLNTLKNSFAAAFAPLVTLIAPIIEAFLAKVNALMQGLSQLIAMLSGSSTFIVAKKQQIDYAKSLEKTGSAAKKASKYLSGLDEIAKFSTDKNGDAGGATTAFEELPIQANKYTEAIQKIKDRIGELKDEFQKGWDAGFKSDKLDAVKQNFKEIGEIIARIWTDPKVTKARQDYEDSLARMAGTIAGSMASIGTSITYGVTEGVKKSLEKNEPYIKNMATSIYENLTEANDSVSEFAETLAEIGTKTFESESFSNIVEKLTDFGTWVVGTAGEAVTGFFKDMVKYFLDPISKNGDEIATVLNDIFDILDLLLPDMKELHEWDYDKSGFHKWLNEMISGRVDTLNQKLQDMHDKLMLVKTALQLIKDQGGLKEWFKQNFSWDAFFKGVAQGFLAGIITFFNHIIDGINKFTGSNVRSALNSMSGGKLGWYGSSIPHIPIPQLATGAVIPPNAPFLATLGDQKNGTNIETPEGLLRQVVREESGSGTYQFTAQINRRVLFDEMISEAKIRQSASGRNPFEFA